MMKILKRSIVTKDSNCGTFRVGDHICYYEDGAIGCIEAGGFIPAVEVKSCTEGMECELDLEYVERQVKQLAEMLKGVGFTVESWGELLTCKSK